MSLVRQSPCKINLILNILGKRPDGFHELETVFQPVPLHDLLEFTRLTAPELRFTCNHPELPTDASNLVVRAAQLFFTTAGFAPSTAIHLEKRLPLAAGLAGGSANAAVTLSALHELYHHPFPHLQLISLAESLGSDVPFFLQDRPALALGRGEQVQPLDAFPALKGKTLFLIHPGFGIATAWAYRELARFPTALHGKPGRAVDLIQSLQTQPLPVAGTHFYNSLEAPALHKYPILALYQEHLRHAGAEAVLMSGSGSTTFAIFDHSRTAEQAVESFKSEFGSDAWIRLVPLA
ncbi:MAG: 4-(cytidine 5'-diphospho)-2-C-methyl-D-erythritol kinase [Verrucomicrobia bacterium]|nr:4-(cytidine 5'-diphospho)-2-C-methyl-D-erythritol kinase [Verrucomicrobiota bacterium]